jgi:polar amino acid transport system permease protein
VTADLINWHFAVQILPVLARGAVVTVETTLIAFVLALALGLVLALLRRSQRAALSVPAWGIIEFIRGTPLLIQIYCLFFVGPSFGIVLSPMVAGLIALGVYYGCFTAEVYRAGLDAVPRGQWESARALNLSRYRTYRDVILPQAIPPMVPALGNYLIDMFKATPILSVISVLEMMTQAKMIGAETFRYIEPMSIVGLFFLAMTLVSSYGIRRVERHLSHGRRFGRTAEQGIFERTAKLAEA